MTLMLAALGLSVLFEYVLLLCFRRPVWLRTLLAIGFVTALASGNTLLLIIDRNVFTLLFMAASLYRFVNVLRLVENRMTATHMRHTTRRTSWYLIVAQAILLDLWFLWLQFTLPLHLIWLGLAWLQLAVACVLFAATLRHFRRLMRQKELNHYTDKQLPAITVAIPARNETEDLQSCLESLLASDYPKLEILVLDDCSQLARTPEIIRGYAHAGVRFLSGDEPQLGWLPKNQAYAKLAAAASGEIIVFCGVDIRFDRRTLRKFVGYMLDHNKSMLSVLPRNSLEHGFPWVQPMRYAWELSLPRRLFRRPPVLSSLWMIKKTALKSSGGFDAVARMVVPEAYFAREQVKHDGYSFLSSGTYFGLRSLKALPKQRDTAVRTRYPSLHKRPEQVWLTSMLSVFIILMPFAVCAGSLLVSHSRFLGLLAGVTCIMLFAAYALVLRLAYGYATALHVLSLPLASLLDICLMNYSMWKYEFSEVVWKGRNVCVPVMRVIPKLPKF